MVHMDFIPPYRPVDLLEIKTANGAATAIVFYAFGSCPPSPFVSIYNDFSHGTFEEIGAILNSHLSGINDLRVVLIENSFIRFHKFRSHGPGTRSIIFIAAQKGDMPPPD